MFAVRCALYLFTLFVNYLDTLFRRRWFNRNYAIARPSRFAARVLDNFNRMQSGRCFDTTLFWSSWRIGLSGCSISDDQIHSYPTSYWLQKNEKQGCCCPSSVRILHLTISEDSIRQCHLWTWPLFVWTSTNLNGFINCSTVDKSYSSLFGSTWRWVVHCSCWLSFMAWSFLKTKSGNSN